MLGVRDSRCGVFRLAWKGTIPGRNIDHRNPPISTGTSNKYFVSPFVHESHCAGAREGIAVTNRIVQMIASAIRQIISVLMILSGSLLAMNASVGPCGGTALAVEPFPAILVAILGLELIVCSYFLVKTLTVESDFSGGHLSFPRHVVAQLGFVGRYVFKGRLDPGDRGQERFLLFVAQRFRGGCEPDLVLSLGRHEKTDYPPVLVLAQAILSHEFESRSISWRHDTESRGPSRALLVPPPPSHPVAEESSRYAPSIRSLRR